MFKPTTIILGCLAFTTGIPDDKARYDVVKITYTDGTQTDVWYPVEMAAVDFATTATWLKQRLGSSARIRNLEFER